MSKEVPAYPVWLGLQLTYNALHLQLTNASTSTSLSLSALQLERPSGPAV